MGMSYVSCEWCWWWWWSMRTMKDNKKKFYKKNGKKIANLTTKWTETKCVQKAPPTNFTNVWNPFPRFWLRPLIEKQNSGTVYHIGLNSTYVQYLLNFWNPHHIMIWRSPYLQEPQKKKKKKKTYYTFFLKKEQEKEKKTLHCTKAQKLKIDGNVNE